MKVMIDTNIIYQRHFSQMGRPLRLFTKHYTCLMNL